MPEAYAWPDGQAALHTGAGATSAVVGYAQQTQVTLTWGWLNHGTLGTAYYDHLTGQRAEVTIAALYTFDKTVKLMAQSATAVHLKLIHSGVNGSAGFWLWSGRIDSMDFAGSQDNPYTWSLRAHFNQWSAF